MLYIFFLNSPPDIFLNLVLLKWQILQRIPTVCFKRNVLTALSLGPDQPHGLTCFSDTLFVDSTAHEELECLSPNQKGV